jgi:hypothetical protein
LNGIEVEMFCIMPISVLIKAIHIVVICLSATSLCAQGYEVKSMFYNTLVGGISAGIGAVINKSAQHKRAPAFLHGFINGCGGGALMYCGKKLNMLIVDQRQIGYAWLSRAVFSAGNSIVENASANRNWWSVWHYDLGFIRLEYNYEQRRLLPRLKVSSFAAFLFTAYHGRLDARTSLRSGTVTFRTSKIVYAPYLVGSTTGNNFLLVDTLRTRFFYEIYAHEMVHTFQFQEYSACNYYFDPWKEKLNERSPVFKEFGKWVYGDLNYELMLGNYFLVQGGIRRRGYCDNFLENEAEVLTTGRVSCP